MYLYVFALLGMDLKGFFGRGRLFLLKKSLGSNLSPSAEPSPSLEAEEPCLDSLTSPGKTSSERCTVNEVFPLLPKPIRLFLPVYHLLKCDSRLFGWGLAREELTRFFKSKKEVAPF